MAAFHTYISISISIYHSHLTGAVDHLPDPGWEACLHDEVPDKVEGHGALLRGLQDDGVAENEADGDGPHGHHEREVEGYDRRDDAQGPPGVCAVDAPADGEALALGDLGEGDGVLDGLEALGDVGEGLSDVLTVLLDDDLCECLALGLHEGVKLGAMSEAMMSEAMSEGLG